MTLYQQALRLLYRLTAVPGLGAAFFAFLDRLAAEAGPKRDLFEALASAGVAAGAAVAAASPPRASRSRSCSNGPRPLARSEPISAART